MSSIQKLSAELIAKIAAGQVVERPVSVVKELVENSLDAAAKNIKITVTDGGRSKIIVQDDGVGMSLVDMKLAIESHTTSKVATTADLEAIHTFGFRGEALHSIVQAAQVTIQSKQQTTTGHKLVVENGVLLSEQPVGMSVGTIITVTDLFKQLPARKKFLKTAKTEFKRIVDAVTKLAFAHPTVGFQLLHDEQMVLDVLPHADFAERSEALVGSKLKTLFLPVSLVVSDYSIQGFLGTPQAATTLTQNQVLLVNNRPVSDAKIQKLVRRFFKTLLPPAIQPPYILYLTLDPATVDINIHPQKTEVRFSEEALLHQVLETVVTQTLQKANLLFSLSDSTSLLLSDSKMDSGTAAELRDSTQIWNVKNYFADEPIMQINALYLIAQTKDGFILIDQHAAHERILYEQFLESFTQQKGTQTKLDTPYKLELPVQEAQLLSENLELLQQLGFSIAQVTATTFTITQVPRVLRTRKLEEYLLEVLRDIADEVVVPELDLQTHRTIAYLACRNAIKAGEVLTPTERKNLVEKLLQTTSKYTCPHGRPVVITVSQQDLEKMFYRTPAFRNE